VGQIRETIFKNYSPKLLGEVYSKLPEAALYIERNTAIVKSVTSFPYIAKIWRCCKRSDAAQAP
jgi:hypothetical protein